MFRVNKSYLVFFISILTIFSFCFKKNFFFIGGTDYIWGAFPTEVFFYYKNNFFFLDYWDNNNLGQPLVSHGYVPIYSFDRIIYFIFAKVNFFYLNNIYFFIKIFTCFYLINKICNKSNIFKPLIILASFIVFFSGFIFYNIIFQSALSQIIFFLIIIYSLISFFQSKKNKYLILLLISFFLFSSSGLLDDAFNIFLVINYFFLYQYILKKISFKELILLLIVIFPGGLFIFSNLLPFYMETLTNEFVYSNNLRNITSDISNLDFFKYLSYSTRIFSSLITGFYDPYSAYFGPNLSHIHGNYPHFFSSFIFIFLIFIIFSNSKKNNLTKILIFSLVILSALPKSFLGDFFQFFLHRDPSIYLYLVGMLPFLLAPSKADVKNFFSKISFVILNKIIFFKNLLILVFFFLILFYFYPSKLLISELLELEFFFYDFDTFYEKIIKFYITFSILSFILFSIILFNLNKKILKYFFNLFFIILFSIYSLVIIFFNSTKNFASNISIYEILTIYTFIYLFLLKFILKRKIHVKKFFILFFLYCLFFSLICFLYNFPNYYSSYLTLPYNFGLKRSFFLVVFFGFFLLINNFELITDLLKRYLNKEINLSYFFEVIKLFLFIEIVFISFFYLSITKFPFYYIKDKNFLNNDFSKFYSYRTNYTSSRVNDFSQNSGSDKEIINNINIIYNDNSSVGGYWFLYGKYSQDLKKFFNLNIYKNYIENINLQKLFGLRFYFDINNNLKDVSYEVNSRFKIFYKELVIQDDLEKIEYIKNNFSTEIALVGKKNINSISSKNSESINPHFISNKKIIFNLPSSIDERIFLFNDNFTKSWKANINGISSDIFRLNYFAMGTKIPSNQNIVLELTYDPIWSNVHRFTLILSFISLLVVFCFLFLVNKYRYK